MKEENYTYEDYKKLERHYNTLAMSMEGIQKDNKDLRDRNDFLEQTIINLENALTIQKTINITSITDMNETKNKLAEDLHRLQLDKRELQERLKDWEDGN